MIVSATERQLCLAISEQAHKLRIMAAHQLVAALGGEGAFSLAQRNQVSTSIAHALLVSPNSSSVEGFWQQIHEETYRCLANYFSELDRVVGLLATEGISLVALKNGGIGRGIYPCLGCCPMGDLDVLVEKRILGRHIKSC